MFDAAATSSRLPLPTGDRRIFSIVLSCIEAALITQRQELLVRVGGIEKVTLVDLCGWFNANNDGFDGDCFEQAVHVAIRDGDPIVVPWISEVCEQFCGVKGGVGSVQFAPEKDARRPTVSAAEAAIADEAVVYLRDRSVGPRLREHLRNLAAAIHSKTARALLPAEIRELWKTDIFLGSNNAGLWAGTTIKINPSSVKPGRGITIAIHPQLPDANGDPSFDSDVGLLRIPLPYAEFTEIFGISLNITKSFLAERGARTPPWTKLPNASHRHICDELERHREIPVLEMVAAMRASLKLSQTTALVPGVA